MEKTMKNKKTEGSKIGLIGKSIGAAKSIIQRLYHLTNFSLFGIGVVKYITMTIMRQLFSTVFSVVSGFLPWLFSKRPSLTDDEICRYNNLRNRVVLPYDPTNCEHIDYLEKYAWHILGSEVKPRLKQLGKSFWIEQGFKTSTPIIDIKEGGLQSLINMDNFAITNSKIHKKMVDPAKNSSFLFGLTSIRVSIFLKRYFGFEDPTNIDNFDIADRTEQTKFKNFCRFLSQDSLFKPFEDPELVNDQAYCKLHDLILQEVYKNWRILEKDHQSLSPSEILQSELNTTARFAKLLEHTVYPNFSKFEAAFQRSSPALVSKPELTRMRSFLR